MEEFNSGQFHAEKKSWYKRWHENPTHKIYHWFIFSLFSFIVLFSVFWASSQMNVQLFSGGVSNFPQSKTTQGPEVLKSPSVVAYDSTHVLVKFKAGKGPDETFLKENQLNSPVKVIDGKLALAGLDRLHTIKIPAGVNAVRVANGLRNNPNVEYAEPDYILHAMITPNDPSFSLQDGLHNTGQNGGSNDADIDAVEAWDITRGTGSIVAVIDTGVDYNHPDLAPNMWVNSGEVAGNGIDDDRNGYIDDVHGYNFSTNTGDPMDDHSHGTHCAGVIGAVGNDDIGIAGINWNARIMALKFMTSSGSGSTSNAIRALNYAVAMGAKISSNSWGGGGYNAALDDAITGARAQGHIVVAAAGNAGSNNDIAPFYPASYSQDNVIAVAATDNNDNLAGFSNYGATSVDVAAPGTNIYSTIPVAMGSYSYKSGTSMATPFVAGVVAMIRDFHPEWTYSQVVNQVSSAADVLPTLTGRVVSSARINLLNALGGEISNPDTTAPTNVVITNPPGGATVSGTITISASASDNIGVSKVDFYAGEFLLSTDLTAPYSIPWNTTTIGNGAHSLTAVAYDAAGNSTTSPAITVTVSNTADTTSPEVSITAPANGARVSGKVTINADASDNVGVTKVEFYVSGSLKCTDTAAPYNCIWSVPGAKNKTYPVAAKAYDAAGNTSSSSITVYR